eukprot:EG_transcript_5823
MALPLTSDTEGMPVAGTIVDVADCHHRALQYMETKFRDNPVVSDTHGRKLKFRGLLAQGAWSAVYRVTDLIERKDFALKVIPQQGTHIISYIEEIKKLATLQHPNIIEVYERFVFQEDDSPCPLLCIRLELCSRFSLEQRIRQHGTLRPLPTTDICTCVIQLASALAYLHRQGLLHGDMCSTNVLLANTLDSSLEVRLANFGSSQRNGCPGAPPLTVTGGSRAYSRRRFGSPPR